MKKKLTLCEASCIITGYGIGSGILAMPYFSRRCGLLFTLLILLTAFIFSYLLHLMIADLAIKQGSDAQIVEIIAHHLPNGRFNHILKKFLFLILAVVLYTNLAVYITGAGEILCSQLNLPLAVSKLLFYLLAAFVALFSLKILGLCEKYAIYAIFAVIISLVIGSLFHIQSPLTYKAESLKDLLHFFSLSMFAFVAFFSVPQVTAGLDRDVKQIKRAIRLGMMTNFCLILLVIIFSQLASTEVSQLAITNWSRSIGLWAQLLGSAFTILAMLTTYWSISTALKDIILESIHVDAKTGFVIASIPSLLIAYLPSGSFLSYLELTAGAIAILIAMFLIPIFHFSHRDGKSSLGAFACGPVEALVFFAYILMAAGSLI